MEMQEKTSAPRLLKDTKKKIRVEYEDKLPLATRIKLKLTSSGFWIDRVWYLFRFLIMLGISYVILSPFFSRFLQSFMARSDFMDATVNMIPKTLSIDIYKYLITENHYFSALGTTTVLSLVCAILQTFVCCMIGYGISKFKFKGKKIIVGLVVLVMLIPPSTLSVSLTNHFKFFDLATILRVGGDNWTMKGPLELIDIVVNWALRLVGITKEVNIGPINMIGSFTPMIILSMIGCGFKNGLYIFMMMQFFKGVPDELEESAYVDGSGPFRTFLQIILPLSVPMMVTIFLFSFSWQWTDEFYVNLFLPGSDIHFFYDVYGRLPESIKDVSDALGGQDKYNSAVQNTAGMMIMAPLIGVYLFGQRYLIQGIERSGIVG